MLVANVCEDELFSIADRFRVLIGQSSVPVGDEQIHTTVSIGATLAGMKDDANSLIRRADGLMYESKKAGRNRVSTGTAA